MALRVAVLFSGGKDSTFVVWHCLEKRMDIRYLVTMEPAGKSCMFHYPNIKWTRLQAKSMGIKQHLHHTSGNKESELGALIEALRPISHDIDAIATGGLASSYQVDRIGKVCHGLGLKPIVPLWHTKIENYWRMILEAGFEVIMTGVAADGLGRDWLGKRIDAKELEILNSLSAKHGFHLGGEGGEFETMVLDGPMFSKKLVPLSAEVTWDDATKSGFYIINDMMTIDKAELKKLMKDYSQKKDAIKKRLGEFMVVGSDASEERLFAELAFCLCTPQSKAKTCWAAVTGLEKNGLLLKGSRSSIEKNLPGVRFHRNKARYIEEAREKLSASGKLDVRGTVLEKEPIEARLWLVENIKGLGYKEASHFMRNIGKGQGIAILDRHILKNLKRFGVIEDVPASLTPKKYIEIEKRMSAFCARAGIPEDELDLLLWSKETGEIFK